jgi:hypothetical protein
MLAEDKEGIQGFGLALLRTGRTFWKEDKHCYSLQRKVSMFNITMLSRTELTVHRSYRNKAVDI